MTDIKHGIVTEAVEVYQDAIRMYNVLAQIAAGAEHPQANADIVIEELGKDGEDAYSMDVSTERWSKCL